MAVFESVDVVHIVEAALEEESLLVVLVYHSLEREVDRAAGTVEAPNKLENVVQIFDEQHIFPLEILRELKYVTIAEGLVVSDDVVLEIEVSLHVEVAERTVQRFAQGNHVVQGLLDVCEVHHKGFDVELFDCPENVIAIFVFLGVYDVKLAVELPLFGIALEFPNLDFEPPPF